MIPDKLTLGNIKEYVSVIVYGDEIGKAKAE
jgi:hypothetical protein